MTENYDVAIAFLDAQFDRIDGFAFYKELFPDNENSGEHHTDFSHPNAIYLYRDEQRKENTLRRRIMLNDTWEQDYVDYVEQNPMTLCSGLTYRRRDNKLENAQQMNALIIDLDGVGLPELRNLFLRFGGEPGQLRRLPMPTFLIVSGNGLHVYYLFSEPVALYPNIKLQMKALKYDLTFRLWEYQATSQNKAIQYQSINQGFRMVGSINDKYGSEVVAYRTGGKVTLDYLNAYADPEHRVDLAKPFSPSKMSREQAKVAYPEWYERVVVKRQKGRKKWDIRAKQGYALYDWWLRQMNGIQGGHRYFYLMCLAIYACKCDVPKEKLLQDMQTAFAELQKVKHENALTQSDIDSAMEAYDKEYYSFPLSDIEKLTELHIERNRRNGRSQRQHLQIARATRDVINENWRAGNGRPSAAQTVKDWQQQHPGERKIACVQDTGLDAKTVRKWWDAVL